MAVSRDGDYWVRHTHQVLEDIQGLRLAWKSADSGCRGYVPTGKDSYLQSYLTSVVRLKQQENKVRRLTIDNPKQQRLFPDLESLIAQKIQSAELVTRLRRTKGLMVAAAALGDGPDQRIADEFQAVISKLEAEESRLLVLRDATTHRRLTCTKAVLTFGAVLGLLIAAVAGWSAKREAQARGLAEAALRESEETYRMLLDGVQDYAIFMLDTRGQVDSWSAGAERISRRQNCNCSR
jgi:CHASE3 domain sensor protein